ncbi:MAG: zinc ribbon domain-containing protein [Synechococcales cyanobacterium C42_A2020_086]|nr:zinc ribbon domain-containing protein [Synechococcales cyanobacterium C42_A2020_086]
MAYVCDLGSGQRVYLENQGPQTRVTVSFSGVGQQQQASSSWHTGNWTAPPEAFQTRSGVVIQIHGSQGASFLQVQGSSMALLSQPPVLDASQSLPLQESAASSSMPPMEPMKPMPPMEPMKPMTMGNMSMDTAGNMSMGDMSMSLNPMEMRMGNMELRMGSSSSSAASSAAKTVRQFCSQCGTAVKPDDRFCASCGAQLD